MVTKEGEGRGSLGVGKWGVQTIGYKIGSRVYCTAWGTEPIFCNNCKWKVSFKNCTKNKKYVVTLNLYNYKLYINYISVKLDIFLKKERSK